MRFPAHFLEEIRERLPVSEVVGRRVQLKKAGREWKGLSPFNKEKTPSFFVNDQKQAWFDFSSGKNGSIFDFVMQMDGMSFPEAVQHLAGLANLPLPKDTNVRARSAEEQRAWEEDNARRETEFKQRQEDRRRELEMSEAEMIEAARRILVNSMAIGGTLAEVYLNLRGLPTPPEGWPDVLRFNPRLYHSFTDQWLPGLVARVDDVVGEFCAIWRIFLDPKTGDKAAVGDNVKLGLGSASGGAVRIGGVGPKIGAGEGLESTLGAWFLKRRQFPIWATLSTSGMMNFEPPIEAECVPIFCDGDYPKQKAGSEELADDPTPAGIKAGRVLQGRLLKCGLKAPINEVPSFGMDYLNVWNAVREMEFQ